MLPNGGQLDGVRLLRHTTVPPMTADHLGPALAAAERGTLGALGYT